MGKGPSADGRKGNNTTVAAGTGGNAGKPTAEGGFPGKGLAISLKRQPIVPVFLTERLLIRQAVPSVQDTAFFWGLWTDPRVMKWVGFPEGLGMSLVEVKQRLTRKNDSPFKTHLIAETRIDGTPIGECFMGQPNSEGIAETDLKLLPGFWQQGYGSEIKRGLLDYLFTHTDCDAVRATPNVENQASIRMQESVGGVRVGETRFESPQTSLCPTIPVQAYIYLVTRATWLELRVAAATRSIQKV